MFGLFIIERPDISKFSKIISFTHTHAHAHTHTKVWNVAKTPTT